MSCPLNLCKENNAMNIQQAENLCSVIKKAVTEQLTKAWDEADHPRDERGRFTSGGGNMGGDEGSRADGEKSVKTYRSTYFSSKQANKFANELRTQGYDAKVGSYRDAFGQTIYSVDWDDMERDDDEWDKNFRYPL